MIKCQNPVQEKPVHGNIAKRIADKITEVKVGPYIHELRYEVLIKRGNILKKLYPCNQAINRYSSPVKQTSALIRAKVKKGDMLAVK